MSTKSSICLLSILLILACGGGGGGSGSPSPAPAPAPAPAPVFDLAGSSYILGITRGGATPGIVDGGITVSSTGSSSGNVTSGSITRSSATATVTGGLLSLTDKGVLSGELRTSDGTINTILYGKLNAIKQFASFVSSTNIGEYDLVAIIKTGSSFASSDIQGLWHISEMTSGGAPDDIVFSDTMTIGAGGSFTTSRSSSGTITIDSYGIINGSGSLTSGSFMIKGVMDASKEYCAFHTIYSSGVYSFSIAIKEVGSFSLPDLAGTWHFTLSAIDGTEGIVSYGTIQLDAAGQVRGGYYRNDTDNIPLLAGSSVSISTAGVLSGNINASDGVTFTIDYGKMNKLKNMLSIAGETNTGGKNLLIANKEI
jgi:hypothetical protein